MSYISLHLQVEEYPGPMDVRVTKPISEHILQDAFQKLDIPSYDADPLSRMFCSDTATIERVRINRKRLSKLLSDEITRAILDAMERNDTYMGYKEKPADGAKER